VLVTGPPERSSRYSSRRTRYGQAADTVTRALRDAAAAAGCAFWDTRAAMGGRGSMRTWLSAGYARRDYTHLTASGYERMGTLLADQLLGAYDAWRAGRPPAPQAAPEPEATVTR
jgi:lysophospholipase L1-like esterase